MKKAYAITCMTLCLFLIICLWGFNHLRNYYRDTLLPETLPPTDYVFYIDINTAGIEELCCLPGVGEVTARNIIEYRNEHGAFTDIRQIQNVKGIGVQTYKEMEPFLGIGGNE